MVGHLRREKREMGREPQEKGQGEDREDLAGRPTQPTGDMAPGNTQPPRIPTDSATVSRRHWEECEENRESQDEGGPPPPGRSLVGAVRVGIARVGTVMFGIVSA
eukprot:1132090-Pyramimonas_sp.AAC.1